jgi:hypothetical protein
VQYDGRSAFWQHPIPVEKIGEFEVRVKICQYEVRALVKSFFSSEKIEDVWYKVSSTSPATKGTKEPNILSAPDDDKDGDGDSAKHSEHSVTPHVRTARLYKIMKFRGTCVRNKAGLFPCPTVGILYDEDQRLEVVYDGKLPLSDFPKPTSVHGEYTCDVPCTDPSCKFLSLSQRVDQRLASPSISECCFSALRDFFVFNGS